MLAPESFQQKTSQHNGMPWNDHAAMATMSSYPFEDSVVDNALDMANEFAYDNNTRLDVSDSYATLRSSGTIDEPAYIYNTNNANAPVRLDETVLHQNNTFATSSIPLPGETHAESLDPDAPSQFYAGDAESFQDDQLWFEAFNLGQPQVPPYHDVHD